MDARDIKQEPPVVEDQRYLEKIYELQMELIDNYVKIEKTVAPPININTKSSQVLLKDFTGRVIEELAEGYESLIEMSNLTEKNCLWVANFDPDDLVQCFNHMQNATEEMADAMHFMVELLIYANIQPEDIDAYVSKLIPKTDDLPLEHNVIAKCMIKGTSDIRDMYPEILDSKKLSFYKIYDEYQDELSLPHNKNLLTCGRRYNLNDYTLYKSMLWDVTYHLNIARNFLKNKPWKQSQMMTNEEAYQEELVKAFICMMGAFYEMGIDDANLYYIYFKKNRINCFRQKSLY